MKPSYVLSITICSVLSLSGCQTSKNLLNGFVGGTLKVAQLPETSSSKIQFVINDYYGMFLGSPNSKNVKVNGKSEGVVATRFVSPLFNEQDKKKISASDLGMPKPASTPKSFNVVERYVNPNEQINIKYNMGDSNESCGVSGRFTPEANTNYRITGNSDNKKCYIILEKFVKDKSGKSHLQIMRFEQ